MKHTKKQYETFLRLMLANNGTWALRALKVIYENTVSNKPEEDCFSARDFDFGKSLYEQSINNNLSPKQLESLHKMMPKYWKQVFNVANKETLNLQVTEYLNGNFTIKQEAPERITDNNNNIPHTITSNDTHIILKYPFNKDINDALFHNKTYARFNRATNTRMISIKDAVDNNTIVSILRYLQFDFLNKFPIFQIDKSIIKLDAKYSRPTTYTPSNINFQQVLITPTQKQINDTQTIENNNGIVMFSQVNHVDNTSVIAYTFTKNLSTLIITHPNKIKQWEYNINRIVPHNTLYHIVANTKLSKFIKTYTYWADCVVVDDSSFLKTNKSARSRNTLNMLSSAKKKILINYGISGDTVDSFYQLNALRPDIKDFGKFWDFANKYSNAISSRWGTTFKGSKNNQELDRLISSFHITI